MNKRSRKQSPRKEASLEVAPPQRIANVGAIAVDVGVEFPEMILRGGLALITEHTAPVYDEGIRTIRPSSKPDPDDEVLAKRGLLRQAPS